MRAAGRFQRGRSQAALTPAHRHITASSDRGITALVMECRGPDAGDASLAARRHESASRTDGLPMTKRCQSRKSRDALEAAHEQGLIHPRQKPANIKDDNGTVKC